MPPTTPAGSADAFVLFVAANRAVVYGTVARWLMHDVRGPAQAVVLLNDLLQAGEDPRAATFQDSLQRASNRLRNLVDLLDRSLRRPPGPADAAAPAPLALRDVLEYVVALQECHRSPVRLDVGAALAAQLPAVQTAEEPLTHALLNLIVNANEALDPNPGTITIGGRASADGTRVELQIEDDGPGVPASVRDHLFEPFTTTKTDRPIAGLGLAVARHLLETEGGTLRYEPLGTGTRFVMELPAWQSPRERSALKSS